MPEVSVDESGALREHGDSGTRIERELLGLLGRDIESGDHDKAGG